LGYGEKNLPATILGCSRESLASMPSSIIATLTVGFDVAKERTEFFHVLDPNVLSVLY
jgi:hypothetical protein